MLKCGPINLLMYIFVIKLVTLPLPCVGRVDTLRPIFRERDINLTTREDIIHAVRKHESVWTALSNFCGQDKAICMHHCGERAISFDVENLNTAGFHEARITCSCDYACIAFEDCCHDFHEACPREVAKYHLSNLVQAKAVCNSYHAFLAYDNSTADGYGRNEVFVEKPVCMKDVIDYMSLHGPSITDTLTGNQYGSLEDLKQIHPKHNFSNPDRLAYWKPVLQRKKKFDLYFEMKEIDFWVQIVQNQTKSFEQYLFFLFQPPDDVIRNRMCMLQTILTCHERGQELIDKRFSVNNITDTCKVIANITAFASDSEDFFKWRDNRSDSNSTIDEIEKQVTSGPSTLTTRRRYNIASTTDYTRQTIMPRNIEPDCSMVFGANVDRDLMDFSYLLKIKTPREFEVKSNAVRSHWNFIKCGLSRFDYSQDGMNESKIFTDNDNKNREGSCDVEVECANSMNFVNGVCAVPILLLLEVQASEGTEQRDFRLAIKNLIDQLGILTGQDIVFWQDPDTCFTGNTGGSKEQESKAGVYYGLYHIFHYDPDRKDDNSVSIFKKLERAMAKPSIIGLNVAKMIQGSRLCTLYEASTSQLSLGFGILLDEFPDYGRIKLKYARNPETRNNTFITQSCKALPWAWSRNIFADPYVFCKTLEPFQTQTRLQNIFPPNKPQGCEQGRTCEKNQGTSYSDAIALTLWNLSFLFGLALSLG